MKSFSSSSFASENAVALEFAADAVKENPYALFTDFQWFLLTGRDTVFFTAFSKSRFDDGMLQDLVAKMVSLAPQLTHGFKGAKPGYPFPQRILEEITSVEEVDSFEGYPDKWLSASQDVFDHPDLPLFRVMVANLKGGPDAQGRMSLIQVRSAHCLMEGSDAALLTRSQTANFVSLAIFIPISGWMADRFGSTNVFRAAIAVFMVGSILCAFSHSLETFVGSRFLQGIGGSMMTPIARLVLLRATPRNELVAATSWLSVPALVGPLTGPPVGGFLTTYLSWHWIFWINVPIGIIGILAATKFLPKAEPRTPRPIDLFGFLLTSIAFSGIIFGLSVISLPAIPVAAGYGAVAVGAIAAVAYYLHARRAEFPLLDPKLFHNRYFRTTVLGGLFFRIGIGAFPFLMPLMLQLTFGLTPFESGLTTFVSAFGAILSKFLAERVYARYGFPRTLTAFAVLGVIFLGINGFFTPETPHLLLMFCLFMGGVTRSFFFTGVNVFGFADVDEKEASQATAISAVAQQVSVALGVAVAGGLLEFTSRLHGGAPVLADFHIAWFAVAAVAAISAVFFVRLPPDAGADVSGHRPKPLPVKSDTIA